MNGDRASHSNTPYFDFELKYGDFVIHEISGYDNYYSHIENDQMKVQRKMWRYAIDFATAFDLLEPKIQLMELEKVLTEKWIEVFE